MTDRTNDKYVSKYSNGKVVSAAQYVTELICENKARRDKSDLHYRFWVSKKWSAYYRNQIASAIKLLKSYEPKAIIGALRDKQAESIYSLRAPHLIPIIEKHSELIRNQNSELTIEIDRDEKKTFRKQSASNNIISKLRELDNGS